MKRRSFLKQSVALGAVTMLPLSALAVEMPAGFVSVKNYGATGNGSTDDSAAVQKAMAANLNVWFPAGTYLVGNLKLRSGLKLAGEGATSILRQKLGAFYCLSANPGSEGYADPAKNLSNIVISNLRFEGQAGNMAFDEKYHLLNLNGVSNVEVANCQFVRAVADGIYLGSSNTGGVERHNFSVNIHDCIFDGFIKNNRNCITIIDGTDITIANCKMLRWGRPDMPGAIDIEPNEGINDTFSRIKRITITGCTIWDMNSMGFIVLALRPNDMLSYPAQTITISNTRCVGNGLVDQVGLLVTQNNHETGVNPTLNTVPLNLVVTGCSFEGIFRPFNIWGAKGITVQNSTFYNSRAYANLSDGAGVYRNMNVTFKNVTFKQLGNDKYYGLTSMRVCGNDYLTFDTCRFEDCGPVDGVNGQGIVFGGNCYSTYVTLYNNTVSAPLARTRKGVTVTTSHKLYAASNQQSGTAFANGVTGNDFLPGM